MTRRRRLYAALTLLALLFVFDTHAHAQEPTTPAPTPQSTPTPQATPGPQTQKLRFLAYDDKGRAADLKRENVHVYVDGLEQPVSYFAVAVSPASYGLLVDNSGSLRSQIGAVLVAAQALVYNNGPSDETFVVSFVASDNIKIIEEFTSDKTVLAKAMDDMYVQIGQTALLDALYLSADYLTKHARPESGGPRRRALVVVTDGEDRSSYYTAGQVVKLLRGGDIQVFAIGLTAALEREGLLLGKNKREKSKAFLEKLTSETGGRVIFAEKVGELRESILEINKSLHAQYVVGYDAPAPDGKKHKVEVRAFGANGTDKLKVMLRPERAAPEPSVEDKKKKKGEDKRND